MESIYYAPEQHGLKPVGEIDAGECYEFDIFVVWQDKQGKLYWATDSGCSCPLPFGDYYKLEDLDTGTVQECHDALDNWASRTYAEVANEVAELHRILADL